MTNFREHGVPRASFACVYAIVTVRSLGMACPEHPESPAVFTCSKVWHENAVTDLCPHWLAMRDSLDAEWSTHDGMEGIVAQNVTKCGYHVTTVAASDEGPGFSYPLGLTETYEQPEVVGYCCPVGEQPAAWLPPGNKQ